VYLLWTIYRFPLSGIFHSPNLYLSFFLSPSFPFVLHVFMRSHVVAVANRLRLFFCCCCGCPEWILHFYSARSRMYSTFLLFLHVNCGSPLVFIHLHFFCVPTDLSQVLPHTPLRFHFFLPFVVTTPSSPPLTPVSLSNSTHALKKMGFKNFEIH